MGPPSYHHRTFTTQSHKCHLEVVYLVQPKGPLSPLDPSNAVCHNKPPRSFKMQSGVLLGKHEPFLDPKPGENI